MRDNILKDVYAQDKVELNSIEVKLGLVDDIESLYTSRFDNITYYTIGTNVIVGG